MRKSGSLEHRARLGQQLRTLRHKAGRSQTDVSRGAGITQASLSNYETGKREVPLSTALNIAAELDVPFSEIVETNDVIVVRDSRLGRAVEALAMSPELIDAVSNGTVEANGHIKANGHNGAS